MSSARRYYMILSIRLVRLADPSQGYLTMTGQTAPRPRGAQVVRPARLRRQPRQCSELWRAAVWDEPPSSRWVERRPRDAGGAA